MLHMKKSCLEDIFLHTFCCQYLCWLQLWAEEGEPKVMWLAGLHAPETYLAALVQAACRERGWPLDRSTLYTQVTDLAEPHQVQEKLV